MGGGGNGVLRATVLCPPLQVGEALAGVTLELRAKKGACLRYLIQKLGKNLVRGAGV